eukprot:128339-Rhodomonas_salina.1
MMQQVRLTATGCYTAMIIKYERPHSWYHLYGDCSCLHLILPWSESGRHGHGHWHGHRDGAAPELRPLLRVLGVRVAES